MTTKDQGRLRRCSVILHEAFECAEAPEGERTPDSEQAASAAWHAYVVVRKLLGDKGPFGK
jgi:hypothetical protein